MRSLHAVSTLELTVKMKKSGSRNCDTFANA